MSSIAMDFAAFLTIEAICFSSPRTPDSRVYPAVIFSSCFMDSHINPEGWHNWGKPESEKTAYYAEFKNYGPGALTNKRVKWSHLLSVEQNRKLTFDVIFKVENQWNLSSATP